VPGKVEAAIPNTFHLKREKRLVMVRRLIMSLFVLSFTVALGACGDTWRGAKKDTGENMQKTGGAITKAGEKVKE
jgi:predicted small secreted protein